MDFVTCSILQGGDYRCKVVLPERRAISYAEVLVLRTVHGGTETVKDLKFVRREEVNPTALRNYLHQIYGQVVMTIYPGALPAMPTDCADDQYLLEGPPRVEDQPKRGRPRKEPEPEVDFPA